MTAAKSELIKDAAPLEEYLASNRWNRVIPEKYGCVPQWRVLEPDQILSKAVITKATGSRET